MRPTKKVPAKRAAAVPPKRAAGASPKRGAAAPKSSGAPKKGGPTGKKGAAGKQKKAAAPAAILTFPPTSDGHAPLRARLAKLPAARERAPELYARLSRTYPDAHCALDFRDPY